MISRRFPSGRFGGRYDARGTAALAATLERSSCFASYASSLLLGTLLVPRFFHTTPDSRTMVLRQDGERYRNIGILDEPWEIAFWNGERRRTYEGSPRQEAR